MTASRANRQVARGDGTNFVQFRRMLPDIDELLLPNIAARKRKLDARVNIAVWRNVRESVSGTAWVAVEFVGARRSVVRTKFLHVPDKLFDPKHLAEFFTRNTKIEDRCVAVDLWRDRRIESVDCAQFLSQRVNAGVVVKVPLHQYIRDCDTQTLGF